jgi:hypothetical protein
MVSLDLSGHPRFRGEDPASRLTISVEAIRGALLWWMGFSGAFAFIEPSPYEVVALITMLVFALTGLALRAAIAPLALEGTQPQSCRWVIRTSPSRGCSSPSSCPRPQSSMPQY